MPCRTYEDEPQYRNQMNREEIKREKAKARGLKKEADKVTRLLCAVLREYEIEMTPELAEWHAKHEAADAKAMERERKEAEKARLRSAVRAELRKNKKEGLARLTKAQKKALGL